MEDDSLDNFVETVKKLLIIGLSFVLSSLQSRDNKKFAMILSFLVPGAGLIYYGNMNKGLLILIFYLLFIPLRIFTNWGMTFAVLSFLVWLYSLYATHMESQKFE